MSDINIREFITIKSDRLNYEDFISGPQTFTVSRLAKKMDQGAARLLIFFEGREDTPFWVPKGMAKCLASPEGWGDTPVSEWVGRKMTLFGEPTVVYGGKELGGVRISHISHIPAAYTTKISVRRGVRIDYEILAMGEGEPTVQREKPAPEVAMYPAEKFNENFPAWSDLIADGKKTADQIISAVQKGGKLTVGQIDRIRGVQPRQAEQEPGGKLEEGDPFS